MTLNEGWLVVRITSSKLYIHRPRAQVVPLPCDRGCTGKGTPPSQKRKDQEGTVPWRHKGLGNPKTFINEGSLAREHVGSLRESGTFIVLVPVATRNQEPCNSISIQYSTLLDCNTYDRLFTASFLHCTLYARKSLTRMWRCIAFRPCMFRDGGGR